MLQNEKADLEVKLANEVKRCESVSYQYDEKFQIGLKELQENSNL